MQQEIILQKYRILRLLGRGGTAEVYLAEHLKLHSYRAIKFISNNHPLYNEQLHEALILKNLKHSCIPIVYDIEEDKDGSYIVEQYIEGNTLKDYIGTKKGVLSENIIIQFALQLCDLIHYLHSIEKPILYLDLKPDNIIVSGSTLKLIDFGSAVYLDEVTEQYKYLGTVGYAAPELYRHHKIDERCDVYSIGMMLYYMTSGVSFRGNPATIENIDCIVGCSKELKAIINRCLKFHPSQRFTSVTHLIKSLSAINSNNSNKLETGQSIRVAVAGAQSRIGVTHLSFRLCNYFIHQKFTRCIYQEQNNNQCIWAIKNCYEQIVSNQGTYTVEGIPMQPKEVLEQSNDLDYSILIQDYGCLTKENLSEFVQADLKILILGAKDWEIHHSEQVLDMVKEYKDILYLFNFINGRQFQKIAKSMNQRSCYRIPYEPDPYADAKENNGKDLFQEISRMILSGVKGAVSYV